MSKVFPRLTIKPRLSRPIFARLHYYTRDCNFLITLQRCNIHNVCDTYTISWSELNVCSTRYISWSASYVLITFKLLFKSEIALETNALKRMNTEYCVESIIYLKLIPSMDIVSTVNWWERLDEIVKNTRWKIIIYTNFLNSWNKTRSIQKKKITGSSCLDFYLRN